MVRINPTMSVIALNVNGYIYQLKEIIRIDLKKEETMCCLQEIYLKYKNTGEKGIKKNISC